MSFPLVSDHGHLPKWDNALQGSHLHVVHLFLITDTSSGIIPSIYQKKKNKFLEEDDASVGQI